MPKTVGAFVFLLFAGLVPARLATADHRVLLQGGNRLVVVEPDGSISWKMPWGGIHDIHVVEGGNILTREGRTAVVEIDRKTKEIVWRYDSSSRGGNQGKRVEVHAFQRLANGRTMIAESGTARIIEVDRDGTIQKQIKLVVDHPSTHSDTRLVRKISGGNYLVAHEADGMVREYDGDSGDVVWRYHVPMFGKQPRSGHGPDAFGNKLFAALRLNNGNTLIATGNGHGVLEVTPEKEIVWQVGQRDLPNIQFAWVTTLEVLPNGHFVIGNCHAGSGQPLLVEIEPKSKRVVWTFDRHADFGNSVSNSLLLDFAGKSIR